MKKLMICAIALSMFSLLGCGGGGDDKPDKPEETPQQKASKILLSGSWKLSGGSIKVDGKDESTQYPGFSLSFTKTGYTSIQGGKLFNASGTWKWKDGKTDKLITLGTKELTITELTSSKVVFKFTFAGAGAAGIAGSYVVTLTK